MNILKKQLALILAAAMVLAWIPGSVLRANAAEPLEEETQTVTVTQTYVPTEDLAENEDLYEAYLERLFYDGNLISLYGRSARDQLNPLGKNLYDCLKENIQRVAAGETASTSFKISQEQLISWGATVKFAADTAEEAFGKFIEQFEFSNVFNALLHDCPYELYWFDKVTGVQQGAGVGSSGGNWVISSVIFRFAVVEDHQPDDYDPSDPTFDTSGAIAAGAAASNAKAIVNTYADLSDYEMLKAYKDEICALVTYDYAAASSGDFSTDADPWQLISVFDGDSSTNVVCEGYAKAFQYLCDMSVFRGDVSCYTVIGTMTGGTGNGNHMWNIVTIGGENYLVDVTNSDSGTSGQDGSLFLAGTSGSVSSGYYFPNMVYQYHSTTLELWGSGEDSILKLAGSNYVPPETSYEPPVVQAETVPMYRLYNPNSGEHFYTGSVEERNNLVAVGWNYEGVAWNAPVYSGDPVYRVYNPNSGDHHYTMSWAEVSNLKELGWQYEGVAWNSASPDNVPQYRLYNPNADLGSHHYTSSVEERDYLVKEGWRLEGIGWYGLLK